MPLTRLHTATLCIALSNRLLSKLSEQSCPHKREGSKLRVRSSTTLKTYIEPRDYVYMRNTVGQDRIRTSSVMTSGIAAGMRTSHGSANSSFNASRSPVQQGKALL